MYTRERSQWRGGGRTTIITSGGACCCCCCCWESVDWRCCCSITAHRLFPIRAISYIVNKASSSSTIHTSFAACIPSSVFGTNRALSVCIDFVIAPAKGKKNSFQSTKQESSNIERWEYIIDKNINRSLFKFLTASPWLFSWQLKSQGAKTIVAAVGPIKCYASTAQNILMWNKRSCWWSLMNDEQKIPAAVVTRKSSAIGTVPWSFHHHIVLTVFIAYI